jgi:hypothetical protein
MAVTAEPYLPPATSERPLRYRLYGLDVSSEIRLPVPVEREPTSGGWLFQRGRGAGRPDLANVGETLYEQPCVSGCHVDLRLCRTDGVLYIWNRGACTFRIDVESQRVTVWAEPHLDERYLAMGLIGQVSSLILHELRVPVLHASAVVTSAGAIAFIGKPTHGKSTMAACFLRKSAQLLTDDALALRLTGAGVEGISGPPIMKMWPAAASALGVSERLTDMVPDYPKKLVTLDREAQFAGDSAPVVAVFVLSRYQGASRDRPLVDLTLLSHREGLLAMLGQIWNSRFLERRDLATLMPIYAKVANSIRVYVLRYPDGFEYHDMIHARIMAEVEARP